MKRRHLPSLFVAVALFPTPSFGQDSTQTEAATLRVFLDCSFCDDDHFRREVPFVNYVRDRLVADLHVLATEQDAASGREYTFTFIGLQAYAGRVDTLRYTSPSTDTQAESREGQVRIFALGVVPFVAVTPIAPRLRVSYATPRQRPPAIVGPEEDPWNFWVFRISADGRMSGESKQRGYTVNGSLTADRITQEWKIEFLGRGNYARSTFDLTDDSSITDERRNYTFEGRLIRSLGLEHWATGIEASVNASTFINRDYEIRVAGGLEYSVFPFSESTRRQLNILYTIGVSRFDYERETVFGVTAETRSNHRLNVAYAVREPWGRANLSVNAQNFLDDFSLHRVQVGGNFRVRVTRGLDMFAGGSFTRIKDQIFLVGAGLTEEEILLRRRQRETDFQYTVTLGFGITFGSIFNNVVNPRQGV